MIFFLSSIQIFRFLFFKPIFLLLARISAGFISQRVNFERKNFSSKESRSFKLSNQKADFCFEVSSEGEFEQIQFLLKYFLERDKKIELIFSSPSVEKAIFSLAKDYSHQIRALRLPLVLQNPISRNPFLNIQKWVTASCVILCRYDFYPELLLFKKKGSLILLSGELKKISEVLRRESHIVKSIYFHLYNLFSMIVATSNTQRDNFLRLGVAPEKIYNYEFRLDRIQERITLKDKKLDKIPALISFLNHFPLKNRIIGGSLWPIDLSILDSKILLQKIKRGDLLLLIAPHKLDAVFLNLMVRKLVDILTDDIPFYIIDEISDADLFEKIKKKPGVLILNLKGVLVELYSYFKWAFVGGGHSRSIHSVLEPFLSSCEVFCGPRVHRSTEFDFISSISPDRIKVVTCLENFYDFLIEKDLSSKNMNLDVNENWSREREIIIDKIGTFNHVK